jgi:hypothetical protein
MLNGKEISWKAATLKNETEMKHGTYILAHSLCYYWLHFNS